MPPVATLLDDEAETLEPRPFAELPPEAQGRAIEQWREHHAYPDWDDVGAITDMLVSDLEYEFGIIPAEEKVRYSTTNGKTKVSTRPTLHWETYPMQVGFRNSWNLDTMLAHGVEGCEYFHAEMRELSTLLATSALLEAAFGCTLEWTFSDADHPIVEIQALYDWIEGDLPKEAEEQFDCLAKRVGDVLEAYHEKATDRLKHILESDIDYRNSDEAIIEELEANDHFLFDDDGDMV